MASNARSWSSPSSGIIRPVVVKRSQLQSNIFHSHSKPKRRPAASSTRMPSGSTSLPMPSPGMTAMRCLMVMRSSAPLVDRGRLLVAAPHDAPVAVGLAADDHHVDILPPEHADQRVGSGLEVRGPRLLAEGGSRIEIVLDELVVPVLAGRHA